MISLFGCKLGGCWKKHHREKEWLRCGTSVGECGGKETLKDYLLLFLCFENSMDCWVLLLFSCWQQVSRDMKKFRLSAMGRLLIFTRKLFFPHWHTNNSFFLFHPHPYALRPLASFFYSSKKKVRRSLRCENWECCLMTSLLKPKNLRFRIKSNFYARLSKAIKTWLHEQTSGSIHVVKLSSSSHIV